MAVDHRQPGTAKEDRFPGHRCEVQSESPRIYVLARLPQEERLQMTEGICQAARGHLKSGASRNMRLADVIKLADENDRQRGKLADRPPSSSSSSWADGIEPSVAASGSYELEWR